MHFYKSHWARNQGLFIKPYQIIDLEQGSQEWHDFRADKYGASMAPVLMGESPWETPLARYEKIVFGIKTESNEAMERGTRLEPVARKWLNDRISLNGKYEPIVLQSLERPYVIASLDGYYEGVDGYPHVLEIKCPGKKAHEMAMEGTIPPYYYGQIQQQMYVSGADHALYLSFDDNRQESLKGVLLDCTRDDGYIVRLLQVIDDFHHRVICLDPPEPSDKDFVTFTDKNLVNLANEYEALNAQMLNSEKRLKEIKEMLVKDLSHRRVKLGNLKVQKTVRKGLIDYSRILVDYEINNAETYRKPSTETWTVRT